MNSNNTDIMNFKNTDIMNSKNKDIMNLKNKDIMNLKNTDIMNSKNTDIMNSKNTDIMNSDEDMINLTKKIIDSLSIYYDELPDKKILKFLLLKFIDFDKLKILFPVEKVIDILDYESIYYKTADNFNNPFIKTEFLSFSQNYYILNLAYKEIYINFYNINDYNILEKQLSDNKETLLNYDYGSKVDKLTILTKKPYNFPINDLIKSLNILDL